MDCIHITIVLISIVASVLGQPNSNDRTELQDSHQNNTEYEIKNGRIHMTLKQYHCAWHNLSNSRPLTFGSKSWVFPKQDVNLVLSYPGKNENLKSDDVITKFNVLLKIDGNNSRGYITSGGILEDHISLSFVFSGIKSLSYQFWLYGMPRSYLTLVDFYTQTHHMC